MKKRTQRLIAVLLALASMLLLSACGAGSSKEEAAPSDAQKEAVTASSAAGGVAETRYVAAFTELDASLGKGYDYITAGAYTEDGFYGYAMKYSGSTTETALIFSGYDGKVKKLDKYEKYIPQEDHSDRCNYSGDSYIASMSVAPDGGLVLVESYSAYWNNDPEITRDDPEFWNDYSYSEKSFVRFLDADGAEKACFPLPVDENEYVSRVIAGDDRVFFTGGTKVKCISLTGDLLWETDTGLYTDSFLRMNDGRLFVSSWGEQGNALYELNTETHELGEAIKIPNASGLFFTGGGDYDLYYSSGSYLSGYNMETGETEKILSWVNTDVSGDMYGDVFVAADGTVRGLLSEYTNDGVNYSIFEVKKVPVSSLKEKKSITLATQYLSYEARNAVIKFNRGNEEYHIDVIDYSSYNTEEDYSAGLMKLQTEILAGNCPDIIDLNGLPATRFASKGLLADLYEFIDADPELNREDFFPTVLGAMECDGKLVSTVAGFYIQSLAGASRIVGDHPGWTYDEFNAALEKMPEGCEPLSVYVTRSDILRMLLALDMDYYVNWATGECRFDSEDFKNLLEFASHFKAEYDWDLYDDAQDSDEKRIASGLQMLANLQIYSMDTIGYNGMHFGGEEITYVGYPTYSGSGNCFGFESGFGMSAQSENKDAAWQFLRTFFTEEYQLTGYQLPSNKKAFDKQMEKAMTVQYEKDSDGNYILDENGEKKPIPMMSFYDGVTQYTSYCLSQDEADTIRELVDTTTRAYRLDDSINSIVFEQAEAYFAGQKSVDEVARLIQSKASIYVNEQR